MEVIKTGKTIRYQFISTLEAIIIHDLLDEALKEGVMNKIQHRSQGRDIEITILKSS